MKVPKISVCVPVFNGAVYLHDCLAAIASQTFADFEVLIVDDCSNDDSISIAERWAAQDARFRVHQNEHNCGLVGNWNRCIEMSRGDWIKFLFQDDLMDVDCLATMVEVGDKGSDFVACSRRFIFEDGCDEALVKLYQLHKTEVESIYSKVSVVSPLMYCIARINHFEINIVGEPSATLIRRSCFTGISGFDPMLVQFCDSEMWSRIASEFGLTFITRTLVTFRVHSGSTSEANRARPFRSGMLDKVVEAWKMCESPEFARFRGHLERAGRLGELRRRKENVINTAFYMLRDAERAVPGDSEARRQLRMVLNKLGGFRRARNRHVWFRFRRLLGLAEAVP